MLMRITKSLHNYQIKLKRCMQILLLHLAMNGLVSCYLFNDFENAAIRQYQAAIDLNPNEAIAWLYKGMLHAFRGDGEIAVHDTLKSVRIITN